MDSIKKVFSKLKNRDENRRLVKWMLRITKPYFKFIICILLISAIALGISFVSTIIGKHVVDDAVSPNGQQLNVRNMLLMVAAMLASIIISVLTNVFASYIGEKFSFGIRQKLFNDIQRSVWIKISKYHSGDLVTRLTSDINSMSDGLITLLPSTFLILFQLIVSFFILLYYDTQIALFALIIGPLGAICMLFFRKKYKLYQTKLRESESEYRTFMQECLSDPSVVKAFMQEDANEAEMERLKNKRVNLVIRNARLTSAMSAVMRIVYSVGYIVAFCWGAYRISTGTITYGTLTVFISLVSQMQGSIRGLTGVIPQIYSMLISAKRISEVTEIEKEEYAGKKDVPNSVGLEVSGVSFAYDSDFIVEDLNFAVKAGEKIGIVGASGAGKTTLIRMLLALTTPQKGEIKYIFDGEREDVCPDSRRFISYVPQGNTLKTGSIADNLRVGKSDATEEQMNNALKMASADKFVEKLPNGLLTVLSEKSGGISEGQAQRIAIARALIGEKPVLILDEATSALDEATESVVLKNITERYENVTCFIITHRRSMLKYCDRVIELDDSGRMSVNPADSYSI